MIFLEHVTLIVIIIGLISFFLFFIMKIAGLNFLVDFIDRIKSIFQTETIERVIDYSK